MNEVFMFAAFGGPAARAAVGMKKQKKRKQKKEGDEEEEELATPFSIFDKNEMQAKMVCPLFFLSSFNSPNGHTCLPFFLFIPFHSEKIKCRDRRT
jgi:hypothetical protein